MFFLIAISGAIKGLAGLNALFFLAIVLFIIVEIIAWVSRCEDNYKK